MGLSVRLRNGPVGWTREGVRVTKNMGRAVTTSSPRRAPCAALTQSSYAGLVPERSSNALSAIRDWLLERFPLYSWGASSCTSYYRDAVGRSSECGARETPASAPALRRLLGRRLRLGHLDRS